MTDITARCSVLGKVKASADSDKVPESTRHTVTLKLDAFERQYHLVLVKVVPARQPFSCYSNTHSWRSI